MITSHRENQRIISINLGLPAIFFILSLLFAASIYVSINVKQPGFVLGLILLVTFILSASGILFLFFKFTVEILIKLKLPLISNSVAKFKAKIIRLNIRLTNFIKRLLNPIYLFPIKLITYSIYYIIKFIGKIIISILKLIIDTIVFPFKSLKNFIKACFILGLVIYIPISLFVIIDYISTHYGYYGKMICSVGVQEKLKGHTLRIVGGYSEGSGFFIQSNQVLTNFHVIVDEPSPKIIFPDGSFITPVRMTGDKNTDLAVLFTEKYYPSLVMPLPDKLNLIENERLIASGYAMGMDLSGKATVVEGNFVEVRTSKRYPISYIQSDISLVEGMSGGPLTDQCGNVVGVNTMSLAGLSFFISADQAKQKIPGFTDQGIKKIEVDPSKSPEDAVYAFYTYLKARRMQDGFNLLSREYLKKTNFEEWTSRFTDILDVDVIKSERHENTKDTAFVKFFTKNWVDGEAEMHFYEGTWATVLEDGVYKMLKSNIKEVLDAGWDWFYE